MISGADQNWAEFWIPPSAHRLGGFRSKTFYGFAQFQGTSWVVVGEGVAHVWCPPPTGNLSVPTAVLNSFGSLCPSG